MKILKENRIISDLGSPKIVKNSASESTRKPMNFSDSHWLE